MRTWRVAGVHGLLTSIAAAFHRLTTLLAPPSRERAAGHSPSSGLEGLPEITFDLSSVVELAKSQQGGAPVQPLWRERSLEDWFRQRMTEVAQRASERREASPLDAFAPLGHAG